MTARLSGAGVRVVLVGTGDHASASTLPAVPAAASTVRALQEAIIESCGVRPENITAMINPAGPEEFLDAVILAADTASDVLVLYYVGHGVLNAAGELHLATQATVDIAKKAAYQALPFTEVHSAVVAGRARSVIVILDCCYSARANNPVPSGALLVSADRDEHALAPLDEPYTAFSGAVIRALRDGIPIAPSELRLHHVFDHVHREMATRGRPAPILRIGNRGSEVVLAVNAAYRSDRERTEPPSGGSCPYLGLQPYTVDDEALFAGRDDLVEAVARRLRESLSAGGITIVSGPSGCGKSSLIHAGVVPAVMRGDLGALAPERLTPVLLKPGEDPLVALRSGMATVPVGDVAVVVVDQFEELFAATITDQDRRTFVTTLHRIGQPVGDQGPAAIVILVVRSDFDDRCARFPELAAALESRNIVVGPMTSGELQAAIALPAEQNGFTLQPGLIEILLRDVGADPMNDDAGDYNPGILPLLSHALLRTWQNRAGLILTVEGYRAVGGVAGAVATTAEDVYGQLAGPHQEVARNLLLMMVRVADFAPDTRRRIRQATVPGESAMHVLSAFAQARLVTLDNETAEITHESLIRSWPRLREWIEVDRAARQAGQEIEAAAERWQILGRDAGALWRGGILAAAMTRTQALPRDGLTAEARAFLAASAHAEGWRARTRKAIGAALLVLVIVASTTAILAINRGVRLDRQLNAAVAQNLVTASDAQATDHPVFATKLALSAWHADPSSPTTRAALLRQYLATRSVEHVFDDLVSQPIQNVRASADGRVAVLSTAAAATVVSGLMGTATTAWQVPGLRPGSEVALSPDGHWMTGVTVGNVLGVWDLQKLTGPTPIPETGTAENSAAFAADSSRILVVSALPSGSRIAQWDTALQALISAPGALIEKQRVKQAWFTGDPGQILVRFADTPSGAPGHLETQALQDGRRVHSFAVASTVAGLGHWIVTCAGGSYEDGPAIVTSSATGMRHSSLSFDSGCDTTTTADGDHVLTSGRSPSVTTTTGRLTSLTTGESYDFVLPPARGSDDIYGRDGATSVIERAGIGPAILIAAGTGVLRLVPTSRDWLTDPGHASLSSDGNDIVIRRSGNVDVIDPATGQNLGHLDAPSRDLTGAGLNPDGDPVLATRHGPHWQISYFDMPQLTHQTILNIPGDDTSFTGNIVVMPDDQHAAAALVNGTLSFFDIETGRLRSGPITLSESAQQLQRFRYDANIVPRPQHPGEFAVLAADEPVQLWDAAEGRRLGVVPVSGGTSTATFNSAGDLLAVLAKDHTIQLWDVARAAQTTTPISAPKVTDLLGFTADGYLVTKAPADGSVDEVELWDLDRRAVSGTINVGVNQSIGNSPDTGPLRLDGNSVMPVEVPLTADVWFQQLCRAFGSASYTRIERSQLPDGADAAQPCRSS